MSDASAEIVQRARDLAPLLAREAAEAERLRRPTDTAIEALKEAGIFRLMVPRRFGGLELDLDAFLDVGLALAEGDGSMAWVSTFYIEHNWMLCQFPESFQRELFADCDHVLAPAMVAPSGVARPADGGLRVEGRWPWATGSAHGDWVIVGARVENPEGSLDLRFLALPRDEVEVEDTWHTDGMRATASNDVIVSDRVVPLDRTVSIVEMAGGTAPGSKIHDGPLYRTPMLPILGMAASTPALGQARAVLADFRERMSGRQRMGNPTKQAQQPAAQMRLARCEIQLRQAELLVREAAAEVMERRNQASLAERHRWMTSFAWAVHQSKDVIRQVAEVSGGSAHFLSDSLQRAKRDVDTMSCHVIFDLDQRLESHGRALLGLDPVGMA